ncbi:MAG: hypothetical protein Q7K44_00685 [Candidatus Liptonbacteria bacterium]|nr:hypothetical protein [Candidatus Liptonbacteria bacterium]
MQKNNIFIGAMLATVLISSSFHRAEAAADSCDFKDNFKELATTQAALQLNDSQENIIKELSVRKRILSQAINCSINETLSLQSSLKLAETNFTELREIKNRIISRLDEIIGYYQMRNSAVNDLGIGGSKIFSANLKSWRDSNYVPMSELGKNFLVFVKNQDVLQTTQNRLNQISLTLKTLGVADNQKISDILSQAGKNIGMANENNDQAKDIFRRLIWPNNVSDMMISSLQRLKDAYQNFFDIGKEAQNIISSSK